MKKICGGSQKNQKNTGNATGDISVSNFRKLIRSPLRDWLKIHNIVKLKVDSN